MREHLGEEYSGVVSSATGFGLFVTLDAMYVEGLVHITELGGEYFRFDEAKQELRGERSGIRYAIGSRVRVQVSRVDLDGRKIDFRLMRDDEELTARFGKDKNEAGAAKFKSSAKKPFVREAEKSSKSRDVTKPSGKASMKKSAGAKSRKPRK
jgi:ribonuclease R